jgi:hypothetical protein
MALTKWPFRNSSRPFTTARSSSPPWPRLSSAFCCRVYTLRVGCIFLSSMALFLEDKKCGNGIFIFLRQHLGFREKYA